MLGRRKDAQKPACRVGTWFIGVCTVICVGGALAQVVGTAGVSETPNPLLGPEKRLEAPLSAGRATSGPLVARSAGRMATSPLARRAFSTTEIMEMRRRAGLTTRPRQTSISTETLAQMRARQASQRKPTQFASRPTTVSKEVLLAHLRPTSAPQSMERAFSLLHSSNRRSSLEPCSCPAHPLGGIDREAKIAKLIAEGGQPQLKVDAGGYLRVPANEPSKIGVRYIAEALAKMQVDAVNVGASDLSSGLGFLQDLQTSFSLPLVSANVRTKNGKAAFPAYRVSKLKLMNGKKVSVAIVGVTKPVDGRIPTAPQPDYEITDPVAALKETLPKAKKESDLIILLAYYTREDVPALLEKLGDTAKSIPIVVCGEFTAGKAKDYYMNNAQRVGSTWVLTGGFEGRQIGHAIVEVEDGKIVSIAPKLIEIEMFVPQDPDFTPYLTKFRSELDAFIGAFRSKQ